MWVSLPRSTISPARSLLSNPSQLLSRAFSQHLPLHFLCIACALSIFQESTRCSNKPSIPRSQRGQSLSFLVCSCSCCSFFAVFSCCSCSCSCCSCCSCSCSCCSLFLPFLHPFLPPSHFLFPHTFSFPALSPPRCPPFLPSFPFSLFSSIKQSRVVTVPSFTAA